MSNSDKVLQLDPLRSFRQLGRQEIIDDIGARAFLLIKQEAEANGLSIRDVLLEHLLGIGLVMASVEGEQETERLFNHIGKQIAESEATVEDEESSL